MIKIAICDDMNDCNKKIELLLRKYGELNGIEIKADSYINGKDLVAKYCKRKYDLIFLDVAMPEIGGYEVAEKVRHIDNDVVIIFCTSFYNFPNVQRGFGVRAKDFLKKPINYNKIESILNSVYNNKLNCSEERFILRTNDGFMAIQISDIIYFKSKNKVTYVFTVNDDFCIRGKLYKLEEKLGEKFFCRCHSSYLVNLDYVEGLKQNSLLIKAKKDFTIPISKHRKEKVLKQLAIFIGEQCNI